LCTFVQEHVIIKAIYILLLAPLAFLGTSTRLFRCDFFEENRVHAPNCFYMTTDILHFIRLKSTVA